MKKLLIIIIIASIFFLGIIYFTPINLDEASIVYSDHTYDDYLESMDLDLDDFLNEQRKIIYNNNLEFLDAFTKINYVNRSSNPLVFSRDWGTSMYLDYDRDSSIEVKAFLFRNEENHHHIMINFTYPLDNSTDLTDDYLQIRTSKNYQGGLKDNQMYLIYKDNQYKHFYYPTNYDYKEMKIALPKVSFTQYFKYPQPKGFIYFEYRPVEDYHAEIFECIIDIYDFYYQTNEEYTLGFNSFRNMPNEKYIPDSLKITYIKEEN